MTFLPSSDCSFVSFLIFEINYFTDVNLIARQSTASVTKVFVWGKRFRVSFGGFVCAVPFASYFLLWLVVASFGCHGTSVTAPQAWDCAVAAVTLNMKMSYKDATDFMVACRVRCHGMLTCCGMLVPWNLKIVCGIWSWHRIWDCAVTVAPLARCHAFVIMSVTFCAVAWHVIVSGSR